MSRKRPPNVPPEASGGAGGQWVLFKGDEMFLWAGDDGVLVEHKQGDFETRWDFKGRVASTGHWTTLADGRSKRPHGIWHYGYEGAPIRRESMWELGVERSRRWFQHGLERSGAIAQVSAGYRATDVEVGTWLVKRGNELVDTIELGPAITDDDLLASPAMREATLDPGELADLAGDPPPRDAIALCAWIRWAGRLDTAVLARIAVRPERWDFLTHGFGYWHDGEPRRLRGETLAQRLQAVLWGTPWDEALEAAGEWLLEKGRPFAALDFLDAAGGIRGTPCAARAAALTALGRDSEAELAAPFSRDEWLAQQALAAALVGDDETAKRRAAGDLATAIAAQLAADDHDDDNDDDDDDDEIEDVPTSAVASAEVVEVDDDDPRGSTGLDSTDAGDDGADDTDATPESTRAAVQARITLLRAFADGRPPSSAVVKTLWRAIPNTLRGIVQRDDVARGFADHGVAYVDGKVFVSHANDLARLLPAARRLDVSYASGVMARLAACAALARYRELNFHDTYLFGGGAAHLAGSKYLAALQDLGLFGTSLYDEDLLPILESKHLGALVSLDLGNPREDQNYTLDGLRPITRSLFAKQLRHLSIARRYFAADVVVDVVAELPKLEALNLEASDLGTAGAELLAGLPHRFVWLNLERCGIDAAGITMLVQSPVLERCATLDLRGNPFGRAGLLAIAGSPRLGRLAALDLGGLDEEARPDAEFIEALARGAIRESIERLELSLGRIGPRGAIALASTAWPRLRRLGLYGNKILDEGLVALAGSPMLATIEYLDLGDNEIMEQGAAALAASPHVHPDVRIELGGAAVSKRTEANLVARFGDRVQLQYPWARRR